MKDRRGHDFVDCAAAPASVVANESKGGRQQKNKMRMFRWGMGGGYGRPHFYACSPA